MNTDATLTTIQRTLFLLDLAPLHEARSEDMAALAARMSELHFAPGDTIYEHSDPERRLYIVLDGSLEYVRDGVVVEQLTRGDAHGMFGLFGLIDSGTLRAVEPTHVLTVGHDDFVEALLDNPALGLEVVRSLAKALLPLTDRIAELEKRVAEMNRSGT